MGSGVDGFVSVQARQCIEETQALLDIADTQPLIRAVVGWVPLASPDVQADLDRFLDHPTFKGVRHVVQDEPDDHFILGEDFNRGVAMLKNHGLVYDILIFARQLKPSVEFVDRHPEQPFVLDHIAKPTVSADRFDADWERDLRELAKRPNVTCKFSGVVTEVRDAEWSVETLRPYFDVALEAFGSDRLMFGSDWPVCLLRSEHQQWLDAVRQLAAGLSTSEQHDFFAGNAARAYNFSL